MRSAAGPPGVGWEARFSPAVVVGSQLTGSLREREQAGCPPPVWPGSG